jgi:PAS domain S-box-containing protein
MTVADTIHVLHVDDEPDFADLAATFLEREDERIAVRTATTAEEALELLAVHDVDCVVSDYDMPGRNGIELLETVRETHPDLPFVLFTGKGSEEVASDAIAAGVTDYLQKERGTDQYAILANRVRNAVEGYRSEREAERTRRQFRAISENSTDAIVIIDTESRIRFANPAVETYFGYTPNELRGEPVTTLMPERHRESHRSAIERYVETGERTVDWSNVEFSGRRKDGTELPLSISYSEFRQDGEQRFIGIMRDVSERTRLEAELRESEEQFRRLAEHIGDVVRMSDPRSGGLIYVNPAYEDVWGHSSESLDDDPTAFLDAVHPEPGRPGQRPLAVLDHVRHRVRGVFLGRRQHVDLADAGALLAGQLAGLRLGRELALVDGRWLVALLDREGPPLGDLDDLIRDLHRRVRGDGRLHGVVDREPGVRAQRVHLPVVDVFQHRGVALDVRDEERALLLVGHYRP